MPDYSALGGISHYKGSPTPGLICLSTCILIWEDRVIRGCAISLVTLARRTLFDAIFAFLSLLLLRILLFSNYIKLEATRFNLTSGIFRLLRNNRCLRSFLIATPAMCHSLVLA
jgi:hypothetical protein